MTDPQFSGPGTLEPVAPLRLPEPGKLFARRAERFATLAQDNTLGEYLQLLARLARAQAHAAARAPIPSAFSRPVQREGGESVPFTSLPPPGGGRVDPGRARRGQGGESETPTAPQELTGLKRGGQPVSLPLDASTHRRDPAWRVVLASILKDMLRGDAPPETRTALELLSSLPPPEVEAVADRVLANAVAGGDLASGPFVAAALQVYFTALASRLDPTSIAPARDACPACGSQPVVGLVLAEDKLRYLVCSLCATQWHHTRVECTACHSGEAVSYFTLEAGELTSEEARVPAASPSSKAEACGRCKIYTKLFYQENDPALEPFADDVATLSLDLLMAESGWQRQGVNLFLLPGEAKAPLPS